MPANLLGVTFRTEAKLRPNVEDYLDPYKVLIPMAFAFMGILLVAVIVMVSSFLLF